MHQGRLAPKFRENQRDAGIDPSTAETGIELTYVDRLTSRVTVQPDLQWLHRAGGEAHTPDRLVVGLRFKIDFSPRL